ncbi:MAG: hypothetical protein J6C85_07655, partial [Alphaproteobacteria bacterium]|nr:hypothetical protein [Alphaproteobacteria bacterium]
MKKSILFTLLCGTFLSSAPVLADNALEKGYVLTPIEITKEDADQRSDIVTKFIKNEDNTLTEKYYKLDVPFDLKTTARVEWKQLETKPEDSIPDVIKVTLPEGEKYFQFTYKEDPNRQKYSTLMNTPAQDVDVDFIGSNTGLFNYNNPEAISVTGDFVGSEGFLNRNSAVENVNGNFINVEEAMFGGSFLTDSDITHIAGDFINNTSSDSSGAMILRGATVEDIKGNFIGNSSSSSGNAAGAIDLDGGKVGNITGDFIGNALTHAEVSNASGSALYLRGNSEIDVLKGNFISNRGGESAIYLSAGSTINEVNGNFINNTGETGAINSYFGKIGNITGDFINNTGVHGAAIYGSSVGNVTGDFINNIASVFDIVYVKSIGDITGDFIGNKAKNCILQSNEVIRNITGNFINNIAGSMINGKTVGNITGDFINNYTDRGGSNLVSVQGLFGDIKSNFIGNTANYSILQLYSTQNRKDHDKPIDIIGDFINNKVTNSYVILISGYSENDFKRFSGNVIGNTSELAGIFWATDSFTSITGSFRDNSASLGDGSWSSPSASLVNDGLIQDLRADFVNNSGYAGAIINTGEIDQISDSDFIDNKGVIAGALQHKPEEWVEGLLHIVNSNFKDNKATGEDASSGAIDSYDTLNIHAEDGNSEFVGNTVTNDDVTQNIAINMETADTALNLSAQNGHILFEDAIVGNNYDINIIPSANTTASISASASSFDEAKDDLAWVKADKLADPATYVRFNNEVSGVNNLSLADGTVMWLGTNGKINSSKMNGLGLSTLTVDVGVKDNALTAGLIETGYLSGQYQVFVNAPDTQNLEGELAQKSVVFLRAEEADENASFKVARVMKSPYLW